MTQSQEEETTNSGKLSTSMSISESVFSSKGKLGNTNNLAVPSTKKLLHLETVPASRLTLELLVLIS